MYERNRALISWDAKANMTPFEAALPRPVPDDADAKTNEAVGLQTGGLLRLHSSVPHNLWHALIRCKG